MSVLKKSDDDKALSILLVDEGQIQHKVLQSNQLDESWLLENLKKEGYADVKQLIYVEWSEEKGFYVLNKEDVMHESYRIDG